MTSCRLDRASTPIGGRSFAREPPSNVVRSSLIRAEARVRNAQAQLRVLTGDLRLAQAASVELTPQDVPLSYPIEVSTRQATITALQQRNDIAASIREIQAVSARVGAARNQVLPRLDLILGDVRRRS